MASAPTAPKPSSRVFSCRCLNVRVREAPADGAPPPFVRAGADADFCPLYVGGAGGGVEATHPQLTLRERSRSAPLPDSPHSARYTSLACLLCQTVVYRVREVVSPENEVREGPVLPSDSWVEVDVLRSADGWIEIHKACPTQEAVALLEKSPRYSPMYSVILPAAPSPPSTPPPDADAAADAARPPPLPHRQYLADLPPLFPPPPFTPKHPVFQHLSALATRQSDALRQDAEARLAAAVRAQAQEIQRAEAAMKAEAEHVWRAFLRAIAAVKLRQHDRPAAPRAAASAPADAPASVVRDFVPSAVPPARRAPRAPPRPSTLSASLATSSFHHPKHASPPRSAGSPASAGDTTSSVTLASVGPAAADAGAGSVLQFRHWANEQEEKNVATSYWYAKNEEAERRRVEELMERRRRQQEAEKPRAQVPAAEKPHTQAQEAAGPSTPQVNGKAKEKEQAPAEQPKSPGSPSGKGKRKVTFIDPEAANKHEKADNAARAPDDDDDMVFDLEEENGERQSSRAPALPLVEPAPAPSRPPRPATARHREPGGGGGLPSSFAGLRPASLPAPSAMRSIVGSAPTRPHPQQHPAPPPEPAAVPLPATPAPNGKPDPAAAPEDPPAAPEDLPAAPDLPAADDFRVRELQRLVAAGTPSHRHAWRRDGDAWRRFLSRADDADALADIAEGAADEEAAAAPPPLVGSLPIAIRQEKPGARVPLRRESSAARRRQMYEARDRERGLDPGALDFAGDEGDEGEESEEGEGEGAPGTTLSRGKHRALKILESAARVPEEGMWRSLAN